MTFYFFCKKLFS